MTQNRNDPSPETPLPAEGTEGDFDERGDGASFPIVGVGASAGGLEAFTQLLKALPMDTGMAFVLIQHLAPSHASALAEILSRATKMPVAEVQDEPTIEPNRVYVIPPDRGMMIVGGTLQLLPREGGAMHRPIDQFFRSLAREQGHQAIGVVLSGTASDGTVGLEAIKAEGGITFAQDATAQHEGMPHSAIASGCVDFVLSPDEIAREIVRIGHHPYAAPPPGSPIPDREPYFAQVLQLLHRATGVDFTHYKFNTLYRRVTRRMLLQKLDGLGPYVQFLRQTPPEVEALFQDILISVTSFFRDPESFEALKSQVFPRLLKGRSRQDPVRIWTLGCSTGQEAYSLAMAFAEAAEETGSQAPLQLFATDLNPACIERARAGVYSKDIALDMSPERLRRFFTEGDAGYRISKTIRDACIFSRHNVLADPPFSRIDLISCRNLLIYLEPVLQQKIVPTLHYALKPMGCLWLGGSETIGNYRNLFEAEDAKHKIYSKKPCSSPEKGHFMLQHSGLPRVPFVPFATRPGDTAADLHKEADRILLTKFAPPGVVVSADLEILQYRGDTGPYLTPAPGKASFSLLKMLREGLLVAVRAAVLRANKEKVPVREEGLRVKSEGETRDVAIEVIPLKGDEAKGGGFLVLFESARTRLEGEAFADPQGSESSAKASPSRAAPPDTDNARLEQELLATREYLQSLIEEQEAANEELQSANEEVQSANEELQSTNEELETSKEEIQSSNEELATVNDELNNRNAELNRVNNDLINLLGSIQMAIVMLGPDLRVRRFTPTAEKLLNLIPADVGRPLADIKLNLDNLPDLQPLLTEVIDTVRTKEFDVRDKRGRWYSLRIRPYKTLDHKIDGAVVLLVDVDAQKRAQAYTESIVATVREPLLVLDKDLCVLSASRSFYETFRAAPQDTITRPLFELGNGQWNILDLRRLLEEVLPQDNQIDDFEIEHEFEQIGRKIMRLNARRLIQEADQAPLILLAIEDVTEHSRLEQQTREQAAELTDLHRRKDEFLAMLSHELRSPLAPISNAVQLLGLQWGSENAIQKQARGIIERQLGQLQHLVDDLLEVSRITTGRVQLRQKRVAVSGIVEGAVETVRPLIDQRHHELTVSLPPGKIWLNADSARLEQVVVNLLTNAAKYTPDGGQIWLTVQQEGDQCVLRVRDTGVGISATLLPCVFDLFTQAERSLDRSQGGLGIGLALVRRLTELHRGHVAVDSTLGQGSEFVVRLPIAPTVAPLAPPSAMETGQATIRPLRVLMVDDNVDMVLSFSMLLKELGHEVRHAHDGPTAVRAAIDYRPDVILLDIGLPGLNGYEVANRIRQHSVLENVVLVALTGYGQDADRQAALTAGFDHHLVKPAQLDQLQQVLNLVSEMVN